jgi:DNA repair exonuclease SbcCD ATPase subunit
METLHTIWLSSAMGAGLFFSAGLLLKGALGGKGGSNGLAQAEKEARLKTEGQLSGLQRDNEESQRLLTEVREQLQGESRVREQLQNDARKLTERATRAEAEVTQLRAAAGQASRFEAEAAQLRAAAGQASRLEAEAAQLRAAAAASAGQVSRLEAEVGQLRASGGGGKASDTKPLLDNIARLSAKISDMTADLDVHRGRLQQREAELAEARAAVSASDARVAQAKKQVEAQMRAQLEDAARGRAEAIKKVEQLQAEIGGLRSQVQGAGQSSAELQAARARSLQLEAALTDAQAKVASLEAAREWEKGSEADAEQERVQLGQELRATQALLRDAKAQVTALEPRVQDADRLRAENSSLRVEMAELERQKAVDPGFDLSTFQRKNAELSLKAKVLEHRTTEFERQAEENHELKTKVEALENTMAENERLVRRVRELEAQAFATQASRVPTLVPGPIRKVAANTAELRLEALLEEALDTLVREDRGCQVAVLSDLRGLLIASSGDKSHQDELAAAASLTTYTTDRIRELLPMSEPKMIQWVDTNRVALRARWLRTEDDSFLLTTLGLDSEPANTRADRLSATISQLISATAEARER